MKYITIISLFINTTIYAQQNLVPNGSFEEYNNCPLELSSVAGMDSLQTNLIDWFNPSNEIWNNTADYFNTCNVLNQNAGVPNNFFGYQNPLSGKGYIGFLSNSNAYLSESIECKLIAKLKKNHIYKIEYFVSLANLKYSQEPFTFNGNWVAASTTKHLKINFFDTLYYVNDFFNFHQNYSNALCVDTNFYYSDTTNWMKISGLYTSKGGESYLVLGQPSHIDTLPKKLINIVPGNIIDNSKWVSYYYFDDVSVIDATNFITGDTQICKNGTITLSTTIPFEKYKWSTGDTTRQITIKKSGWYWCTISEGCDAYTDSIYVAEVKIDSLDVAMPNLGADINNCYAEAEYWPKTISINTTTNAIDKIRWSTNAIDDNQPSIAINQAGIYWANIYNYCDSKTDTIFVSGCPPKTPNIFAPNIFTPNDDGINDVFAIQAKYVNMQSLTIFDRWGTLVHEDKIYFNWAGFSKGKRCDVGTYYYIIKYTDWDENIVKVYSGDVVLVR